MTSDGENERRGEREREGERVENTVRALFDVFFLGGGGGF